MYSLRTAKRPRHRVLTSVPHTYEWNTWREHGVGHCDGPHQRNAGRYGTTEASPARRRPRGHLGSVQVEDGVAIGIHEFSRNLPSAQSTACLPIERIQTRRRPPGWSPKPEGIQLHAASTDNTAPGCRPRKCLGDQPAGMAAVFTPTLSAPAPAMSTPPTRPHHPRGQRADTHFSRSTDHITSSPGPRTTRRCQESQLVDPANRSRARSNGSPASRGCRSYPWTTRPSWSQGQRWRTAIHAAILPTPAGLPAGSS